MKNNEKKIRAGFSNIILNDLWFGCKKNIIIYFLTLLFAVFSTLLFYQTAKGYFQCGRIDTMPGVIDYFVYLFGGIKPLVESNSKAFQIPVLWMTIQMLVSCSVCIYPINDLYSRGSVILLQFGSRVKWWISKCIWSFIQVIIIYLILYTGVSISVICCGGSLQYHTQIATAITDVTITNINLLNIIIYVVPVIYSIMIVLVQVNLSIVIGPVNSIICIVAYNVLSAYILSPILLGNYSMIYRITNLTGQGVVWLFEPFLCGCISVFAVLLGIKYFCNLDILDKYN